ncbi:spermidine/putrescine ABC transporter permease [Candidatus Riesia sp. GBBU]|nr:spermidine/putrescine ABC transporter permease [Candidatus Riesia sp. GBBU]
MIIRTLKFFFLIVVYLYLYIPIIILVFQSFNDLNPKNLQDFGQIDPYKMLVKNESLLEATYHSLIIAFVSSSVSTLIGSIMAIAIFRYDFFGKRFMVTMLSAIMLIPDIIMAIGLLLLFIFLRFTLGFWSLLFSHITFCLPFISIIVYARLKSFDSNILEAAKDLGANEIRILQKIIFPLSFSSMISGWLISFFISIDDVIISSFVTGPMYDVLPLKIYSMIRTGVYEEINALTSIFFLISLIFSIFGMCILNIKQIYVKHSRSLNIFKKK